MEWTKEKPNARGFYWVRIVDKPEVRPIVVEVGKGLDGFCIAGVDEIQSLQDEAYGVTEWYGPIQPPE